MSECLSTTEIIGYVAGSTPPDDRPRIEAHLKVCESCKRQVADGQRTFFRSALRTTLQVVVIGLAVGGVPVLAFVLASAAKLFANLGKAYSYFPSVPVSRWATFNIEPVPTISLVASGLLFALAMIFMGWSVVALIQPRRLLSAALLSLGAGIVAGLASYMAGIGWPMVLTFTVVASLDDMKLLADVGEVQTSRPEDPAEAVPKSTPQDRLLERYPDLASVAEKDRSHHLMTKIIADQVVGSYEGIFWGLFFPFALFGLTGFAEGVIAGALLQRGDSRFGCILPYLEIALPTNILLSALLTPLVLIRVMSHLPLAQPRNMWHWVAFFLAWVTVAMFAVAYRWPFWARWSFYLACEIALGHLIVDLWTIPPEVSRFADLVLLLAALAAVSASIIWGAIKARLPRSDETPLAA